MRTDPQRPELIRTKHLRRSPVVIARQIDVFPSQRRQMGKIARCRMVFLLSKVSLGGAYGSAPNYRCLLSSPIPVVQMHNRQATLGVANWLPHRSHSRRCAGLLRPLLNVHSHNKKPQAQRHFCECGSREVREDPGL
jgi:hypothetical protein